MKYKYILLSHIYDENTPSYGNRDKFENTLISSIARGDSANSSAWKFTINHLGTHIDFPKHFYDDGSSLSDFTIDDFIFNNPQIIDIKCEKAKLIEYWDFTSEISPQTDILLIKTGYEQFRNSEKYWNDNPGLSAKLGKKIRNEFPNLRAVGFDFISLTSWKYRKEGKEAHKAFLNDKTNNKFMIIEDMSLNNIKKKKILTLYVIPLMVKNANGSPVTIFGKIDISGI